MGEMYAGKYVTNLSRPDNNNSKNNNNGKEYTQTMCAAQFGLSQEVYVAVSPGSRDVDEDVETKLCVAVVVVGVKVPLKCFQRIHKTVKKQ